MHFHTKIIQKIQEIAFGDRLDSAPKNMKIEGISRNGEFVEIGSLEFDIGSKSVQTFSFNNYNAFQSIRVNVESNWGNPNYTCIYRIRVHGQEDD